MDPARNTGTGGPPQLGATGASSSATGASAPAEGQRQNQQVSSSATGVSLQAGEQQQQQQVDATNGTPVQAEAPVLTPEQKENIEKKLEQIGKNLTNVATTLKVPLTSKGGRRYKRKATRKTKQKRKTTRKGRKANRKSTRK